MWSRTNAQVLSCCTTSTQPHPAVSCCQNSPRVYFSWHLLSHKTTQDAVSPGEHLETCAGGMFPSPSHPAGGMMVVLVRRQGNRCRDTSGPLQHHGRGCLAAESSSTLCMAGLGMLLGAVMCQHWACQGVSQSPPVFQAACCRWSNQLSFTFPAPNHPKTAVTSPQLLGKAPSPVCQHPYFMFTCMQR